MAKNEQLQDALDLLENGIKSLINSEHWKEFLMFQSAFHNYSFGNQVLIWIQKPNATRVAGFGTWKKLGRFVKKGEKSIKILAPMDIKVKEEDESGDVVEKKVRIYRPVSVFDLEQTDGQPLPNSLVERLEGDFELYTALKDLCPIPVHELPDCDGANGYYHLKDKTIAILQSLSEAHKTKTLIHEWCHSLLHDKWLEKEGDRPDSQTMEIEAESSAFVVCHHLGLDTSAFSFGYVAGWAGGESAVSKLRASGERIQKVSNEILKAINGALESEEEVLQAS